MTAISSGPIRPEAAVVPDTRTVVTRDRGELSTGPGNATRLGPVAPSSGESSAPLAPQPRASRGLTGPS